MHMKTQPRTKMREVPTSRHLCAEHVAMRRLAFYGPLRRVSGKDGCIRVTLDDLRVPSNTYEPPCIRSPGWRFFSRMLELRKLASVSCKARKPKIQPESFWQEVPAFRSSRSKKLRYEMYNRSSWKPRKRPGAIVAVVWCRGPGAQERAGLFPASSGSAGAP